jgi:Fe-S-cluster containining protein
MKVEFHCLKCGECCKHLVGDRFGMPVTPEEHQKLAFFARRHGIDLQVKTLVPGVIGSRMYQMTQERCPFLDATNRCRAYHIRPLVCRMFPLHPFAVKNCSFLDKVLDKSAPVHLQVAFPMEMKLAVIEYMHVIQPVLRESTWVYNLNRGWVDRTSLQDIQMKLR